MAIRQTHRLRGFPVTLLCILRGLRRVRIVPCFLLRLVAALCVAASMTGCIGLPRDLFSPEKKERSNEAIVVNVNPETIEDASGKVTKETKCLQELRPAEERPELWTGPEQ